MCRHAIVSLIVVLAAASCTRQDAPTAARVSPTPSWAISDAVHDGGTPGFFILPPMVQQPAFTGAFDADITTLNPQVAICDVTGGPDTDCGGSSAGATPAAAVFTTTSTPAVTVDTTTPQYQVNWDTKAAGFVVGDTYRVHVRAGATGFRRELGFADILLTTTPGQVKHLATDSLIVLQDGRTLPIHFRIETGIAGELAVNAAAPSVQTGGTDLLTATVQDLHGAALVGATVAWTSTSTPATGVVASLVPTSGATAGDGTSPTTFVAGASPGTSMVSAVSGGLSGAATVMVQSKRFVTVAAGWAHTCGLTGSGQAYCWGYGGWGEGGDGTQNGHSSPVAVLGGLEFTQIAVMTNHVCGLASGGRAYCWGADGWGELGSAASLCPASGGPFPCRTSPTRVDGGLLFTQIVGGYGHTCGLDPAGHAYCWGLNAWGELGNGQFVFTAPLGPVVGGLTFTQLAAGQDHTCGLTASGQAYCWGLNGSGQLGSEGVQYSFTPIPVSSGIAFVNLSVGTYSQHTCGLTAEGHAYCWGDNSSGALGDGSTTSSWAPVAVTGGLTFTALTGGDHTCGLTASGAAYCWGNNGAGQLGNGTTTNSSEPVTVIGGLTFTQIASGESHTCGLASGGTVYCWGANDYGQLGDGTTTYSPSPVQVPTPQ